MIARSILRPNRISTMLASLVLAIVVAVCVLAPIVAPFAPDAVVGSSFQPSGGEFLLGTDQLGRDMLSRLIFAARNTFGLALGINIISFLLGCFFGLLAVSLGGWKDQLAGRFIDMMMAIPQLVLALLVLAIFGTSLVTLVSVITFIEATRYFRVARSASAALVSLDFIDVAVLRGEGTWWHVFHELLPNARSILLAEFGIRFCYICLFISSLSFLGIGLQPPAAELGSMVRENAIWMTLGNGAALLPASVLAAVTVSVNLMVDSAVRREDGSGA